MEHSNDSTRPKREPLSDQPVVALAVLAMLAKCVAPIQFGNAFR